MAKRVNPEAMRIADAVQVLRSVEVSTPWSAYELNVVTRFVKGQAPPRGRIALPRDPRSKEEKILVFAEGKPAEAARKLGASFVGGTELIADVLASKILPTKVISTPEMLPLITPKLARFLGPKGLMPSAKRGTVTEDTAGAIKQAKGMLDWKGDRQGVVRAAVGRIHFPVEDLEKNVRAFIQAIKDSIAQKDVDLIKKRKKATASPVLQVHLSSRQGPGIQLVDV
jgi:large subunit ribosomal protein L1